MELVRTLGVCGPQAQHYPSLGSQPQGSSSHTRLGLKACTIEGKLPAQFNLKFTHADPRTDELTVPLNSYITFLTHIQLANQ
jgi:hypothetical protein